MPMRILVPLERRFGVDTALPVAYDLARARGAVVRLLHVARPDPPRDRNGRPFAGVAADPSDVRREALGFLDMTAAAAL
ncbi:MAG TPA: hypothetical protein VF406_02305, partial [Thermodesulfobacteriota bacterium]